MMSYMMVILAFLALYDIVKKVWYHIWYFSYYIWYHIVFWKHHSVFSLSCAIFMTDIVEISYDIAFDIRIIIYQAWFCIWYGPLISILLYIKARFDDISAYVMAPARRDGAGLGAPGARARPSTSFGLAIANVLGTCVELNSDGLDPAHGLVAVAAARAVHCGRFVVIEKSRLAAAIAAGCAAKSGSNMKFPH